MSSGGPVRCAVLGSPIAHSKSPDLHRAAYRVLGLDWSYEAIDVTGDALREFIESRDESWRGLSLTMPLKRDVLPLLNWRDDVTERAGGANTVVLENGRVLGYNTDVYGVVQALRAGGVESVRNVHVLGGGATAASVIVAAHELGAARVLVSVRTPANAESLAVLGAQLGIEVVVRHFGPADFTPDAVVSTLPGGAESGIDFSALTRSKAVLLDVAYDPWPSALASSWLEGHGTVVAGIEMLVHQALAQVRIFVGGDPGVELPDERAVFAAMRESVGLAA